MSFKHASECLIPCAKPWELKGTLGGFRKELKFNLATVREL